MYLKQRRRPRKSGRRKSSSRSKKSLKLMKRSKRSKSPRKGSKRLKSPKRYSLHRMASMSRMNKPFIGSLSACGNWSACTPCMAANKSS